MKCSPVQQRHLAKARACISPHEDVTAYMKELGRRSARARRPKIKRAMAAFKGLAEEAIKTCDRQEFDSNWDRWWLLHNLEENLTDHGVAVLSRQTALLHAQQAAGFPAEVYRLTKWAREFPDVELERALSGDLDPIACDCNDLSHRYPERTSCWKAQVWPACECADKNHLSVERTSCWDNRLWPPLRNRRGVYSAGLNYD